MAPTGKPTLHSISRELNAVLERLDPQTASLLERTVRDAVALADRKRPSSIDTDSNGYPAGYFEATEGSFAGEPLECAPV